MEMIKTDCKIFQDTITMSFSFGGGGNSKQSFCEWGGVCY